MANILNEGLSRTLGIEFEFKLKLQTLLTEFKDTAIVQAETTEAAAAAAALTKFIKCGPAMGFEAKRNAYACLEQIVTALKNSATVPAADDTALTSELVNVTRYVGLEGEEDFHFMVAVFNLCELISGVLGETETEVVEGTASTGGIATVVLIDGGSGYTTDGSVDTAPSVIYNLEGTEDTGNGSGATADVEISSGVVTSIAATTAGSGYSVGDILVLGVSGAQTLGTPAIVEVTAIS